MVKFECDGCGAQVERRKGGLNGPDKPGSWFSRRDEETGEWFHACSRPCIKQVAHEHSGHSVVLPV